MNLAPLLRVLAFAAVVVVAVVPAGCPAKPPVDRSAVVFHVDGDVTAERGGRVIRLVGGEPLVPDDVLTTAPASVAVLLLSNGWLTRLDASTTMRVGGLVAFDKPPTSTPAAEQLEQILAAGERTRLPSDDVLAERVAGVEQRLRAATSPAATAEVGNRPLRAAEAVASAAPEPAAALPAPMAPAAAPVQPAPPPRARAAAPALDDAASGAVASREASSDVAAPPGAAAPPPSAAKSSLAERKDASPASPPTIRQLGATTGDEPAGTATMDVLRARSAAFGACAAGVSGNVVVVFTVNAAGAVTAVTVERNSTGVASTAACVADNLRRTRLPARAGGVSIRIEVRFGATDAR